MAKRRSDRTESWTEFLGLWDRFRSYASESGTVVLVEGEHDRVALRELGIEGPIEAVHRGESLSELTGRLGSGARRLIVLTDWDLKGGRLARRVRDLLDGGRLEVDLEHRRRLARVLKGEVVHVEGLRRWARRCAERAGAPLDYWLGTSGDE